MIILATSFYILSVISNRKYIFFNTDVNIWAVCCMFYFQMCLWRPLEVAFMIGTTPFVLPSLRLSSKNSKISFFAPHHSHSCLVSPLLPGVCEQRVGDQHRGRRQLWRAGSDLRHPEGSHSPSQDQRQAVGHRQRQLQENTHGEDTQTECVCVCDGET